MTDIAVRTDQTITLWNVEEPEAALEQASKVASAAMRLINDRGLVQTFSGRTHVMVDGWLCIARLAKVRTHVADESTLKDDKGNVLRDAQGRPHGWQARIEVIDANGDVVGDAVSQCARDENTWKNRDDYAVRSMAQTRATGKALRVALGFVATMAGFEATPAEEMSPAANHADVDEDRLFPPVDETGEIISAGVAAEAEILERTLRLILEASGKLNPEVDALIERKRSEPDFVSWLQAQITRAEQVATT